MTGFELDGRLAADTTKVADLQSGPLLAMNDSRWPWLILVPAVPGAVELHDLDADMARLVHDETDRVAAALKRASGCEKINTGALGNIVRQLHIHVVARSAGDPNWPGPVWGYGTRIERDPGDMRAFIDRVKTALGL